MATTNGEPNADGNYQSTNEDKNRARLIGLTYIALAIFLAWMLFKIWPPTPWPTDKAMDQNPQLVKNLADCECPTPTPTPAPQPTINRAETGASENTRTATPTTTPTPTATVKARAKATVAPPQTRATDQAKTQNPAATVTPTPSPTPPVATDVLVNLPINFFWGRWCYRTSFDERLILLVIVAGILGSFVHSATSLADFVGNNKFNKNWTWFYLLRPSIGMSLALVFYFVVRGGFLTTSGGAKDINPYGIAALAGLVGMFSKQATDKLSEVFSTLFRAAQGEGDDKRAGSLHPDAETITISGVEPKSVVAGSKNQELTVSGTNFTPGSKVLLNETAQATTFVSTTKITASIADALIATPGKLKLKVINPGGKTSSEVELEVK
jgi:IPT/TIG domain